MTTAPEETARRHCEEAVVMDSLNVSNWEYSKRALQQGGSLHLQSFALPANRPSFQSQPQPRPRKELHL